MFRKIPIQTDVVGKLKMSAEVSRINTVSQEHPQLNGGSCSVSAFSWLHDVWDVYG